MGRGHKVNNLLPGNENQGIVPAHPPRDARQKEKVAIS